MHYLKADKCEYRNNEDWADRKIYIKVKKRECENKKI